MLRITSTTTKAVTAFDIAGRLCICFKCRPAQRDCRNGRHAHFNISKKQKSTHGLHIKTHSNIKSRTGYTQIKRKRKKKAAAQAFTGAASIETNAREPPLTQSLKHKPLHLSTHKKLSLQSPRAQARGYRLAAGKISSGQSPDFVHAAPAWISLPRRQSSTNQRLLHHPSQRCTQISLLRKP